MEKFLSSWTTPAVSPETILSDNGTTQTVKVTVPLLDGQRLLCFAITAPQRSRDAFPENARLRTPGFTKSGGLP